MYLKSQALSIATYLFTFSLLNLLKNCMEAMQIIFCDINETQTMK